MRITLRTKLLLFAIVLALIPLGISGRSLIQITQDELKNSANEELSFIASQIAENIDEFYTDSWLQPLRLIRNGVDNPDLALREKVSLLTNGTKNLTDIVALQITIEGIGEQVIAQDAFAEQLRNAELDPIEVLTVKQDRITRMLQDGQPHMAGITYLPAADAWMTTIALPLEQPIRGRKAYLAARVNLDRLRMALRNHPHNQAGEITLIDIEGHRIFDKQGTNISDWAVVREAQKFMLSDNPPMIINPFTRPDGEKMLTAVAFPAYFRWGVIVEENQSRAYAAIAQMTQNLVIWLLIGLSLAAVAGIFGARTLSRPIVEIGKVAGVIGTGDLSVRVEKWVLKNRDEIGDLGTRMNEMIQGLRERFQLTKFVSESTVSAIQSLGDEDIKRGGERREATVFFSDIRGFTSFSEDKEPEVVIEMLNKRLSVQADLVRKFGGDVDKYVGDELVALFMGENMVENAVRCAAAIQASMYQMDKATGQAIGIGIGINTGEMVMGAMGSADRMDFTIIGDNVNLGARLCSAAKKGQIILSGFSARYLSNQNWVELEQMEPIMVKGKAKPIPIYRVTAVYSETKPEPKA